MPAVNKRSPTSWALWVLLCAAAGLSLWLRTAFPAHAIPDAANDDGLFVNLARALIGGHWLGGFDKRTLVKGMFYPLFIAMAFAAGIPTKIAEQIFYLAAAALIARVVRMHTPGRGWFAALVFCAVAFNPMLWTDDLARVIREGIYLSLAMGVLGFSILASFGADGAAARGKPELRLALLNGLLAGLTGGCFWLTREEGVWLVPSIACIALLAGIDSLRRWLRSGRTLPAAAVLLRLALPWFTAASAALLLVGAVATVNRLHYGAFETTEVQSLAFRRAYGALARIKPNHWVRYVVFPRDARIKAYKVSPAARELEATLDGPIGNDWREAGCEQTFQTSCPEILAGWFQWALRDAVAASGHYQTAATAAAYYTRLANEIDTACDRQILSCLAARATLAPPFRMHYVIDALREVPRAAFLLFHPGKEGIDVLPSEGAQDSISRFADIAGPVMPPPDRERAIRGWATAATGAPALFEELQTGTQIADAPEVAAAPDVDRAYPHGHAVRFSLRSACSACILLVTVPDQTGTRIAFNSLTAGTFIHNSGLTLYVESSAVDVAELSPARRALITRICASISMIYGMALTPACVLACLGLVVSAFRWKRLPPALLALAIASGVGVTARVALLCYLDVTAIPSFYGRYESPAEPLLIIFICVGCWIGARRPTGCDLIP